MSSNDLFSLNGEDVPENEQLKLYQFLVQNSSQGVIVTQKNVIKFVNRRITKILSYQEEELINHNLFDFVYPSDRQDVARLSRMVISSEIHSSPGLMKMITKEGEIKQLEFGCYGITLSGKPTVIYFVTDVTDEFLSEETYSKIDETISGNEAFLKAVSELNKSIINANRNINIAKMLTQPDSVALERLGEADEELFKTQVSLSKLLDDAKVEKLSRKVLFVDELLMKCADFILKRSNSIWLFSMSGDAYPIEADESELSLAISNILINSCEAMPNGGIIEISVENVDLNEGAEEASPPLRYVKISITDHGVGIDPEDIDKIFEPYFTTKRGRHGLGLAVASLIVRKYRGFISVSSKLGVSTTFTICIPALDERVHEYKIRGRILVMDDEPMICDIIKLMLTNEGFDVATTTDGYEAVELYWRAKRLGRPFDVVLLDLTVPNDMSGPKVLEELKKYDPKVKAVLLSGHLSDPAMVNFEAYGFKGTIIKPFKTSDLINILNRLL